MTTRPLVLGFGFALGFGLGVGPGAVGGLGPRAASAQSSTTGAIQGQVFDEATGESLAGVTIVVSSTTLLTRQTAISDDNGFYKVTELPPGNYRVTFSLGRLTVERSGITVGLDKTTPVIQRLRLAQAGGEVVRVVDIAPTIDPTSTKQGITLDKRYLQNVPTPGRTFESSLGAAAGSQGDSAGVAFSGSSSLENQYFVDGINTTGLTLGTVGTPVITDFIEEIEVVTGGYNAEYGRATGGVVNVVTKTGTNELRGSLFATLQPGALTAAARPAPVNASSIDAVADNAYQADVGFELSGPIRKDRLWYFVGFAPQLQRTDITRTTKRQTDCRRLLPSGELSACDERPIAEGGHADGFPDIDPRTGFFVTDQLDAEIRRQTRSVYHAVGKLNFAATPEHQMQVTLQGAPRFSSSPEVFGLASSGTRGRQLTTDLSAKWTSKLNDRKTQIEAVIGWHRDHQEVDAIDPAQQDQPLQALTLGSLGRWAAGFGGESEATIEGCDDDAPGDRYPLLATNCPMTTSHYRVGGPGAITRSTEQRRSAAFALTERIRALGSHEIKGGLDVESNTSDKARLYSGGALIENFVGQRVIRVTRWVQLKGRLGSPPANANTDPRFDDTCRTPDRDASPMMPPQIDYLCDYLGGAPGDPGTQVHGHTVNWSAFLRDSWQVLPNLTFNLGLRYEEQRLRYASFLQNTTDPLTQVALGINAMTLQNMWAPRVGAIYDWTQEGRSKIYAHWGRFYESIPMDINDRSFGGEIQYVQDFVPSRDVCGTTLDTRIGGVDGNACLSDPSARGKQEQLVGAGGVLIAPGVQPQYLDEIVAGAEYEVLDDLKVGVSYQNRVLGRAIDDVSTDGAQTFVIANPGEWSAAEEARLAARIAHTVDPVVRRRLESQLRLFQGIRAFDRPRRDYNALQLTLTRRFSDQLYMQGSYTYSRVTGNYPGLASYDDDRVDPNISSQYDLVEMLANREGALPQDRPHYLKLDGYYLFDLHKQGALIVGGRFRAFSGIPENAQASHAIYGGGETFLLPRGALGRTEFDHGLDLHVEYARRIGTFNGTPVGLSLYVDLFNVYDHQGTARVDGMYAPPVSLGREIQHANPVSGGAYEDLIWVKRIDEQGVEQAQPLGRNPNFRNPTARYAPAYCRLGARITF